MRRRPCLAAGIASFFTVLFAAHLSLSALTAGAVGIALLVVTAMVLRRRGAACLLAVSLAVLMLFTVRYAAVIREQTQHNGQQVTLTARVTDVQGTGDRLKISVREGDLPRGTRLYVWAGDIGGEVRDGDIVKGTLEVVSAFDATRPLAGRSDKALGVWLYAWPAEDTALLLYDGRDSMNPLWRGVCRLREGIRDSLSASLSPTVAALCEAMLIGEKECLPQSVIEAFRACGIYHVLAVSGLHMSVLVSAVYVLLRAVRCPRRPRALVTMALVVLFVVLCGGSASITRSGVMAMLMLFSGLFRRRADGLNSLGMAATVMLLADPFCVYDVGWQLSFAATLGLLLFHPVWEREITARIRRVCPRTAWVLSPLFTAVGVTVCATLTTLPITALWFGEMSAVFLPCNLVLVPLTSVVLVLSVVAVLTTKILPFAATAVFWIIEHLCRWLCAVTQWIASFPWCVVWIGEPAQIVWLFVLPFALTLGYCWFGIKGIRRVAVILLCVACTTAGVNALWRRTETIVRVAEDIHVIVTVQTADGYGAIFTGDNDSNDSLMFLMRRDGRHTLDWALWVDTPAAVRNGGAGSLTVEHLIVTADPSSYASLPSYRSITVLRDGTDGSFVPGGTLASCRGWYRLTVGDRTILTATSAADAADAPWQQADMMILPALLPYRYERLFAPQAVLCGEEHDVYRMGTRLLSSVPRVISPAIEGDLRLRLG